jgi:DNA polymerase sigma
VFNLISFFVKGTVLEKIRRGAILNTLEKKILDKFKALILRRAKLIRIILFGSRARGDAEAGSDMDVVVILDDGANDTDRDYVSDCAWEAGFEHGIVVVPVVFTQSEWESGPEHYSLLVQAVERDGVPL